MMEWTPSNMAPWQSQQYSVRHTRTVVSRSLILPLSPSTLSINCGCSDDPNATVNTDDDEPWAHNQIKQIWNIKTDRQKNCPVWCVGRFHFFFHCFKKFGDTNYQGITWDLWKLQTNFTNDLQVWTAFMTTASHLVSKCITRPDPRWTLSVPACSTLYLLYAEQACVCVRARNA